VRLSSKRPLAEVTLRTFFLAPRGGTRVVVERPRLETAAPAASAAA
jgi:hypothetical protein